jgi:predicted MFS family arabinose efflux permease
VSVFFLLYGVVLGAWTSRIPAIKQRLGLGDGQLSVGLLAFAAGAIVGMQLSGRLVDRYGSATIMAPAAVAVGGLLIAPAHAGSLPLLASSLLAFGTVLGCLNVAMNANALEVQRAWQGVIISSFHAVYSVGGFLGAAAGGLFASAGLGAGATFTAVAAVAVVTAGVARRWVLSTDRAGRPGSRVPAPAPAPTAVGSRRVTFLGGLVFCCLVGEGAAADWSTVYLRDDLGSTPGIAAAAYASFAAMMLAGRLAGDRLASRLGPVRLVRGSAVLAAAGLTAGLAANRPAAGVIGFGLLGAGLSSIAPQVFSAAGNLDPARAGQAIARVAGLGFLGLAVGPVLIGAAAELVGLPVALLIPAVLVLTVALAAPALRPPPTPQLPD